MLSVPRRDPDRPRGRAFHAATGCEAEREALVHRAAAAVPIKPLEFEPAHWGPRPPSTTPPQVIRDAVAGCEDTKGLREAFLFQS